VKEGIVSRRRFLQLCATGVGGALVAACAPKVVEKVVKETVEVEKVVKEVVKETVIVAGTPQVVEKEVTKIVKETVVVEKAPEEPDELQFWGFPWGLPSDEWPHGKWESEVSAKYTEMNPLVKIQTQPLTWAAYDKLVISITGGNPPNLCLRAGVEQVHYALEGNCALEVELPQEFLDDLVEGWWEGMTFSDGKHWCFVPFFMMGAGMVLNVSLVEEAGATDLLPKAPSYGNWDFDQYTELMKKCTFDRGGGRHTWGMVYSTAQEHPYAYWPLEVVMWNWGADYMEHRKGEWVCTWNEKPGVTFLQWLYDLYDKHKVLPNPNGQTVPTSDFWNQGDLLGGVGLPGDWQAPQMEVDPKTLVVTDTELDIKWRFVQHPTQPGVPNPLVWGGPMLDVNTSVFKTRDRDAIGPSIDFALFLSNKENQNFVGKYTIPARKSAVNLENPMLKYHFEYLVPYGKTRSSCMAGVEPGACTNFEQGLQKLYLGTPAQEVADEFCQLFPDLEIPEWA